MPQLAIVAFPTLRDPDRQWMEACRQWHDPQAHLLPVHFTLVFPLVDNVDAVLPVAESVARDHLPITFILRKVEAVPDLVRGGGCVFLVPDEGHSQIIALHDRLYESSLKRHLRSDIPYSPHMTIAADANHQKCRELARELSLRFYEMRGSINQLSVLKIETSRVTTLSTFELGTARVI